MLTSVVDTGELRVLENVVRFTEARHEILANNIANIDTPGYKVKDLDVAAFQKDLQRAANARQNGQLDTNQQDPQEDLDQYLLFHDRTNHSIEKQMTAMTKNGVLHKVAVELLRTRYGLLERAVSLRF